MGGKRGYLLASLIVLVLDQWTKHWAEQALQPGISRPVIDGLLNFTLVKNTGVAFGLFAAGSATAGVVALTVLGLAALAVVGVYFYRTPIEDRLLLAALALIMGGAVGNLADRIAPGGVTDFIDFYYGSYHWHTFNIADTAISVGIGLMILEIFRPERAPAEADA